MNHLYIYIIYLTILSMFTACKNEVPSLSSDLQETVSSDITIDQAQFTSSNFELGTVEQRPFSIIIQSIGTIHVPEKNKAAVSTIMGGTLGAINLIEGEWVSKGQKLFTVTNPELINLQEEYLVANGQLEYLREEYNRLKELSKENLSTTKDLLKAKSELTTTEARHGSLSKKLELYGINTQSLNTSNLVSALSVIAPISGYISHVDVMRGMYIEPNQSALILANTSHIHLDLSILEKDAMLLARDQKVTFSLQGNPEESYTASIHLINKSINEHHMISVHCEIDGDTKKLLPGMFANASIVLDNYKATALPESAVIKMGEVHYGLVLTQKNESDMTFEKTILETGRNQDGYIELIEPIAKDAQFLTKGAYFLIQ